MKSPGNDSQAEITIFDAYGKKVRTLSEKVFVGKNLIYWNGFGNNSESLSTGAYYYRLLIISDDYFDPYFGSLMISR
jgi:flagellar hook assembly protein FlgD